MPAFDGTGPREQGPRTGRGLGNCPPSKDQRPPGRAPGRGLGGNGLGVGGLGRRLGRGLGRGLGFRRPW